ncbi:MAG: HXXEE domain-containing protein [Ktedonobacteraceae bacterium]
MNYLRRHWFDVGLMLAMATGAYLLVIHPIGLTLLLWLSLITLFLHQWEEYRFPGYFPGMMNSVMFSSRQPDRYPLNAHTSLTINVLVGWLFYFLAAVFNEKAVCLGIATLLVSVGNIIAHTFLFNIKGKTVYNPGMVTAIVFFLPLSVYFFSWVIHNHAASTLDWIVGAVLGIALNYIGIIKMIDWMKDENTPYVFPARCLVPGQQKMHTERL